MPTTVSVTIGDELAHPEGSGDSAFNTYDLNALMLAEGYPLNGWQSVDSIVVAMTVTVEPPGSDEVLVIGANLDGVPSAPTFTADHDPNPPDGGDSGGGGYGVGYTLGSGGPESITGVLIADGQIEITFDLVTDIRYVTTAVQTFVASVDSVTALTGVTQGTADVDSISVVGEWHHFPLLSRGVRAIDGADFTIGATSESFALLEHDHQLFGADFLVPAVASGDFPLLTHTPVLYGPTGVTGGAKEIAFPLLPRKPHPYGFLHEEG